MANTLITTVSCGESQVGLALKAQLKDTNDVSVGGEITTGFSEVGRGIYKWKHDFPDGFHGSVNFYTGVAPGVVRGSAAINPQEAEYAGRLATAMELDGAVWRFTTNALEQAPSSVVDAAAIKVVTDKVATMIEADGPVWRYTINALENAPSNATGGEELVLDEVTGDEIVIEETVEELVLED